jgi:hypothetical protein
MDATPPAVLDAWLDYDAVEPIPVPWAQSATIASEIYELQRLAAAKIGSKMDFRRPADWIPTRQKAVQSKVMSHDDHDRMARRMAGLS